MRADYDLADIGRPTKLYIVGESNVLPYSDLLIRDRKTQFLFQTETTFIRGLRGHLFVDEKGAVNSRLVQSLLSLKLLGEDGVANWMSQNPRAFNLAIATGDSLMPLPILLQCGDIDCRSRIMAELADKYDFEIPENISLKIPRRPTEKTTQIIPYSQVLKLFRQSIDPFMAGVKALIKVGLTNISVHCVPPPTANDELFTDIVKVHCPLAVRYKVSGLYNHLLRTECEAAGIPFIDVWPLITDSEGVLLADRELDGVHFTRETAVDSLNVWLSTISSLTYNQFNSKLWKYTSSTESSDSIVPIEKEDSQAAEGNSTSPILSDLAAPPIDLSFDKERPSFSAIDWAIRPDWCSDPIYSGDPIFSFSGLNETESANLFEWLYSDHVGELIQRRVGFDYVCYSAVILRPNQSGTAPVHTTPHLKSVLPDNLHKLIYIPSISDSASVTCKTVYADGRVEEFDTRGNITLLLNSDVHNFELEGDTQSLTCLQLWLGIKLRGMPRIVICGGANSWPADPYQYPVADLLTAPPLQSSRVSIHPIRKIYNVN